MARICIVTPSALGSNPAAWSRRPTLPAEAGHTVRVISTWVLTISLTGRDEDILASAALGAPTGSTCGGRWSAR